MSLASIDGSPLAPLLRPYLNWTDDRPDRLERFELVLGTLDDERFPGGIIPIVKSQTMLYYAIAPASVEWRRLIPLLRSAVGPTITDFTGPTVLFDEDDPLEAVLIENGYLRGARFTAGDDWQRGRYALAALARLRRLVGESGITRQAVPRATGEVLRRFELALAAHDRQAAEESLSFLRTDLRLDAVNLDFLTVRLHATFLEWNRIRQLDFFPSLCQTRRTARVTNDLAEAIYHTILLPLEQADDPEQAFAVFSAEVLPYTGNLFDSCPVRPTPAAGKAFLLAAGAVTPPRRRVAERLDRLATEWPADESKFFKRLLDFGFPATTSVPDSELPRLHTYEDEIEALRAAEGDSSLERARAGVIAATQVDSLDAFGVVLAYAKRLKPGEFNELRANSFIRTAYDRMLEAAGGRTMPESWIEWISGLDAAPIAESQEFARRAAGDWRVKDHLSTKEDVLELAKAIATVPPNAQDRLFDSLPYLVQWVQEDKAWPENALHPLYRAMYDHLVLQLSLRWQLEAGGAARQLLDGMLQLGPDADEYNSLLNDIGDVLPPEAGTTDFDGLIELAELVVTYASPNPDSRQRLWGRVVAALNPVRIRLARRDIAIINDLGQVFGIDQVFPVRTAANENEEAPSEPSPLDGKTLAIYTLTEAAGQRAKRILGELHPGVQVQLTHDTVSSPQLEELARHADFFVVCWRSAAHAATQIIERLRPRDAVTLYPTGKGSSSILRVIEDHFRS